MKEKKNRMTWFLFVLLAGLSSCTQKKDQTLSADRTNMVSPSSTTQKAHDILAAGDAVKGQSIYPLEVSLTDQSGQKISFDVFKGSPVVVSMFYGSCPYSCPLMFDNLKRIEGKLDPSTKEKVRFLLMSIDPENDTPKVLKELAEKHKVPAERWKVAATDENKTREIAAVLGVQYRKMPDGNFNHSSLITLLDSKGQIQAQYEGINPPLEEIAARLKELSLSLK